MSSDDQRVSTDELLALAQPVHVDQLDTTAFASPWAGDVGSRAVQSATFGNLELILTHGDVVLHGADRVEAERFEGRDGGTVPVVDLAAHGFSRQAAEAAVLSIRTHYDRDRADPVMLAELVTGLAQIEPEATVAAGWDGDSLDTLLDAVAELEGAGLFNDGLQGDPDDIPEPSDPPAQPVTKAGDVWTLGPHRIMSGDCRNPDHVATLLDGATINLAFTSPPYADRRTYDETSGFKPIPPGEYVDWFEPVQANVAKHLAGDGSWFVNIKAASNGLDTETYVLDLVLAHARQWGWHWATEFCWERAGIPGQPARRFKNQFEPVLQFALSDWKFRPDAVAHESSRAMSYAGSDRQWSAAADQGRTYGEKDRLLDRGPGMAFPGNRLAPFIGAESLGHAAAFPVGLPDFFVRAYTDEGDTVFDPFMGSGSTLLAADQNDRVGFGMEISPGYCDVICRRFEQATGVVPVRGGEPVSFLEGV